MAANKKSGAETDYSSAMLEAIHEAGKKNTPFGAILIDSAGNIVARSANTTAVDGKTAHAELNLLQEVTQDSHQLDLKDHTLVTTCEPCPMCMGAAIWCGVGTVVYGASIADITHYFNQIDLNARELAGKSFHKPRILGGILHQQCIALLKQHSSQRNTR